MAPRLGMGKGPMGNPGRRKEKPRSFTDSWKGLFSYMMEYRVPFILAVVAACLSAVASVIGPHYLSVITDLVESGLHTQIDLDAVAQVAMVLTVVYIFGSLMTFIEGYSMSTVSQRTASRFRYDIARKINRLPLRYFDNHRTGDILSRVTNDVDTIGQSLNQGVVALATSMTLFIGSLSMMLITDYRLALVAVCTTLFGVTMMRVVMKRSQKYFVDQQRDLGEMNSHVDEVFSGHTVVKAFGGEEGSTEVFFQINSRLYHTAFRSQFLSRVMIPMSSFTANLGYLATCLVGSVFFIEGSITFGTIVAFMFYSRMFSRPLNQISEALITMQSVAAAAERVFEFIGEDEVPEERPRTSIRDVRGRVEFRDVHFGYVPDKEVIRGFSAIVEPGHKVAIVGPTGAGKTTIVNLLMRFYDIQGGDIMIDDVPTRELTRENVHDLFCMVLQDAWIFNGTIRENIVYCKEGVTDDDLDRVCEAAGLKHLISTLPDGYDTPITDLSSLSVGQRQQVTIARAMIQDSPMLILDEATSSVDTRTERTIQDAMDRLTECRTSFVIAHRLSTIRNADLILVMDNGCIVEKGTHDELLDAGGYYRQLYDSQFSD